MQLYARAEKPNIDAARYLWDTVHKGEFGQSVQLNKVSVSPASPALPDCSHRCSKRKYPIGATSLEWYFSAEVKAPVLAPCGFIGTDKLAHGCAG